MQKPEKTIQINLVGSLNILKAAYENNVEKVILASLCAIYGDNTNLPLNEENLPIQNLIMQLQNYRQSIFLKYTMRNMD